MTIKEKLVKYLDDIGTPASGVVNPDKKDNTGGLLFDAYVWQEISALADLKLKQAWAALEAEGVLPKDDVLRNEGPGEHIVVESNHFSALAKVTEARKNFNRDAFVAAVAKKYRIPADKLALLAETYKEAGKAPLQKKVLEV